MRTTGAENLGALSVFVQAAETRSFTAAGRQLGISASAVGKAIARLEDRLGVRLFHRSTRSISLTSEGALFLDRCHRILGELEAAELELSQASAGARGKLRVSLPMIGMLLMPAINDFMLAWPQIELDLDFTDRFVDVIEEGFDAVMRTGDVSDSRLIARTIGTFGYAIVGAPAYFARRRAPLTPAELTDHACLQHRYPSTGKLEPWRIGPEPADVIADVPVTAVASTLEPLIAMAEAGLGLTYVPLFTVRRQIAEGRLRPVLEADLRRTGVFRILWPSSRHTSPRIRTFVDFMSRRLFAEDGASAGP